MKAFNYGLILLCLLSIVFSCTTFTIDSSSTFDLPKESETLLKGIYKSTPGYTYEVCSTNSIGECVECYYASILEVQTLANDSVLVYMRTTVHTQHFSRTVLNPCIYRQVKSHYGKAPSTYIFPSRNIAPLDLRREIM